MPCRQSFGAATRRLRWAILGCLWISGIVGGQILLARYETAPGVAGSPPQHWPAESRIPLSDRGHTLVMFAHPRCPCTRASLAELAKIRARSTDSVTPWVVFFKPSRAAVDWDQTDQWFTAAEIPGVYVLRDVDGVEARRFHAMTSGQTMLYNSAGELVFSGGITLARGQQGDNAGRSAIESLLRQSAPKAQQTPTFGCPIIVPSEQP
jgi:hypothetical protein